MSQSISVVVPVYNGVTQLDFTGPHQFLSRTPDLHVRVASLEGKPVSADRLTFSNLENLAAIKSCDVLLVPGGGGCLAAIENDLFLKEIARLAATARYLTSVCTGSLILVHPAGSLRPIRRASYRERLALHGPAEWLGHGGVEVGDEGLDPLLQVLFAGEIAAAQQLAHQDREPDLDLVDP